MSKTGLSDARGRKKEEREFYKREELRRKKLAKSEKPQQQNITEQK